MVRVSIVSDGDAIMEMIQVLEVKSKRCYEKRNCMQGLKSFLWAEKPTELQKRPQK